MGNNSPLYLAKRHYERALEILPAFDLESDAAVHDVSSILTYIALLASHLKEGAERVSDFIESVASPSTSDEKIYKIYESNQKIRVVIEFIRQTVGPHIAENDLEIGTSKPIPLERDFGGIYQAKARIDAVLELINPLIDA
jgi:hypothetical protein